MSAERFETSRAGRKLDNPVLDAFAAVDVTLHLDSTGQAQSVTGFENILPYIAGHSDSATAASVAQMLNPSLLELRQLDEWNSRIGRLKALSLDFNQHAYDQGTYPLPDGSSLDLFSTFSVTDTSRIGDRLTLRVAIDSDSNPVKLAETTGLDSAAIVKQFDLADARVASFGQLPVRSFTHIELIVDAHTLMVRQEASMSTLSVNINDPQAGPQTMKIIDRRTIDYDYPAWE